MRSKRQSAIQLAKEYYGLKPVFLDTETTGLGPKDEIIDISIVDFYGNILFDSLVKPQRIIPADATRVHKITNKMVQNAPTWIDIWPEIQRVLKDKVLVIYNEDYDIRLLKQSCQLHGVIWHPPYKKSFCIMKLYAEYYGEWNNYHKDYTWQKLENAGYQCNINLKNTHRALDDTFLSRAVLFHMAGEDWLIVKREDALSEPEHTTPKIILVKSYRDGTGNTNIVANLAAQLAIQGKRVGLIDLNLLAPGLHEIFGLSEDHPEFFIDDFLYRDVPFEKIGINIGDSLRTKIQAEKEFDITLWLFPSSYNISKLAVLMRNGYDANKLNGGLQKINELFDLDYLLIDSLPGIQEESLLTMSIVDHCIFIMVPNQIAFQGTIVSIDIAHMLDIPSLSLIVNKVPVRYDPLEVKDAVEAEFETPVLAVLPICLELLEMYNSDLFSIIQPEHPWSKEIIEISKRLIDEI